MSMTMTTLFLLSSAIFCFILQAPLQPWRCFVLAELSTYLSDTYSTHNYPK